MTLSIHKFAELAAFAEQFGKIELPASPEASETKTLIGPAVPNVAEFNRRALIALNGVGFGRGGSTAEVVAGIRFRINMGQDITLAQQQALFNICHRYRRQITDRAVTSYAAGRAKGADA
jgi:hypothetical protein